jgi:transcriptional regulator with XRE-family HTH domain
MSRRPDTPRSIDAHLGARLRELRRGLGWSEELLGLLLKVSAARIRAYESGAKPITARRLVALCELLEAPIAYFFSDFEVASYLDSSERSRAGRLHRMTLELLQAFVAIPSERHQAELLARAKLLSGRSRPGRRGARRIPMASGGPDLP